jgi:galactokinase
MSVTDRILSALTTVIRMNDKVEDMAGLMKEQQRRIDELNSRVIRLETVLELALNRSPLQTHRLTGSDSGRGTPE